MAQDIKTIINQLKENYCSTCAYGSNNMDSCDIRYCDNRDYLKTLEEFTADVIEREVHDKEVASLYNQLDMWQSEHANRVLELGHLREKIDKAIEEIENKSYYINEVTEEMGIDIITVKDILKKHIDVEVEE